MQSVRTKAGQKQKLVNSYNELFEEFSAKELRNVGNYSLGRMIGKGSFGKVYLATHKLTNGSKVVLKSSKKDDSNLAREIHHHRQFVHPHIARLYEVIVTENMVWLVLEYCPGDELYNYLLNHGALPLDKVRRIFAQLAGAVAYVHSKSCVHRDLKLENILFDKHENVKLVDFGFTREYEGKASYLQTFCGTICYSAPEMLKGEKYAGEKVDVWSLGIILYALLSGELPFDDDDDLETKRRILSEDPKYNEKFPEDAKALINSLLSKRPLLRPTLEDLLKNPFLGEHGAEQQAILARQRPSPFSTALEKTTLQRMKSAGVNIDQVIENVLAQRCDALAGWWALLIEKEEKKEKKREQKRREKESELRSIRRLSAASARLERIAPLLPEVDEEGAISDTSHSRGRKNRRSFPNPQLTIPEVPKLPEQFAPLSPDLSIPPSPIDKDSVRSASSSRHRPIPPPKERRVSRPSVLHPSASQPELASHSTSLFKRKIGRRNHNSIMSQLASLKHWFLESTKRAKSPHPKANKTGAQHLKFRIEKNSPHKNQEAGKGKPGTMDLSDTTPTPTQIKRASNASSLAPSTASYRHNRNSLPLQTRAPGMHNPHRNSLSPSPLTPRNSYRRSSTGLRGRKSTSSSISSVRSIHHAHSLSKASSTSENSIDTVSTPTGSIRMTRSPHTSVKVLPTTPSGTSRFPNNIRVTRHPPNALRDVNDVTNGIYSVFNESAPAGGGSVTSSPSSGLVFAKRKRSAFKGPMLNTASLAVPSANAAPLTPGLAAGMRTEADMGLKPLGRPGTRKSQIIEEEEDAEGEDEEEIEEVETFTPEATKTSFDEIHATDETHVGASGDEKPLPVLAPPADIRPSSHPPRSSSLKEHPESLTDSLNGTPETTVLVSKEEGEPEASHATGPEAPSEAANSAISGEATSTKVESSE